VAIYNVIEEPPFLVDETAGRVDNRYCKKDDANLNGMFFTYSPSKISGSGKKFRGKYMILYIKSGIYPFISYSSNNET